MDGDGQVSVVTLLLTDSCADRRVRAEEGRGGGLATGRGGGGCPAKPRGIGRVQRNPILHAYVMSQNLEIQFRN
jgi:hypothetical protein